MRAVTQEIAAGGGWDAERAAGVASLFDGLAPEWHERVSPERLEPLTDAIARGGVAGRRCLDALPGDWSGVAASAGWGDWLVARRSGRFLQPAEPTSTALPTAR